MARLEIVHVAGTRPNFVKLAAVVRALSAHPRAFVQRVVHTGQHYDASLSRALWQQLELPEPDVRLDVGPAPPAVQIGRMLEGLAAVVAQRRPDWIVVYGDVSSTLAGAVVGAQENVPVAHVEAGLRCWDRSLPEELNRLVVDQLSALLFTPSADADDNLRCEGIGPERVRRVGNVMIDTLLRHLPAAGPALERLVSSSPLREALLPCTRPEPPPFVLATLHRPHNVERPEILGGIVDALRQLASEWPVVFTVHPRTRSRLAALAPAARTSPPGLWLLEPLPYLEFVALEQRAAVVVTDSGGVQEETLVLGTPCVTVRPSTERPVTLRAGLNQLVEPSPSAIVAAVRGGILTPPERAAVPELWDGRASDRIADALLQLQR